MARIFGTDGARGIAVTQLTCERAMDIGRAAAKVLAASAGKPARILVGMDTRISSEILLCALAAGICSMGADAEILGVVPTPAVSYLLKRYGADAGVMISASHNPAEYNGIKLFSSDGCKLPDETEAEIEALILDRRSELLPAGAFGRVIQSRNAVSDYSDYIIQCADIDLSGMRIALDCANGSASICAQRIFSALGAECLMLCDAPDGYNINDGCGSTHLERLCGFVRSSKADVGFAFDGDADRCLACDEYGTPVDGDSLIAILAQWLKSLGRLSGNTAVVTVMSGLGLKHTLARHGIETAVTKVGDRYVHEEMEKHGYNLGGEQSGHIILSDYAATGDGELTAVLIAKILRETGKTLSQLCGDIARYPQTLLNVRIQPHKRSAWKTNAAISAVISEAERELGSSGRVLVRESGTEPLIRVMTEGKDERLTRLLAEEIADIIRAELS